MTITELLEKESQEILDAVERGASIEEQLEIGKKYAKLSKDAEDDPLPAMEDLMPEPFEELPKGIEG